MRYEEAARFCLVEGVDITSTPLRPGSSVIVVKLTHRGCTVRGAVPASSSDSWKTGFAQLVEELREALTATPPWVDEQRTAIDLTWVDEAPTDPM